MAKVTLAVRVFAAMGTRVLLVTNAGASLGCHTRPHHLCLSCGTGSH